MKTTLGYYKGQETCKLQMKVRHNMLWISREKSGQTKFPLHEHENWLVDPNLSPIQWIDLHAGQEQHND